MFYVVSGTWWMECGEWSVLNLQVLASAYDGGSGQSFLSTIAVNESDENVNDQEMSTFIAREGDNLAWQVGVVKDVPYLSGSATQYVRLGAAGMLVSVGSYHQSSGMNNKTVLAAHGGIFSPSSDTDSYPDMAGVQIYDIATRAWFAVNATGDIPSPRKAFCSAVSAAPDDSSFQMVVHGGTYASNTLDDVYVLTIPAFHWIKMNATFPNGTTQGWTTNTTYGGRSGHY